MTDPMPPCPYSRKKEGHDLSVLIPDNVDHPAVLFCDKCGATKPVSLQLPAPLDEWSKDEIARITTPRPDTGRRSSF